MHDVAAGEVHSARLVEEAVEGPLRVADKAVHKEMPEENEYKHRGKLHSLWKTVQVR